MCLSLKLFTQISAIKVWEMNSSGLMNWPNMTFASALINIVVKLRQLKWQAVEEEYAT